MRQQSVKKLLGLLAAMAAIALMSLPAWAQAAGEAVKVAAGAAPVDATKVGGWAGALTLVAWAAGWMLKQDAFGGFLEGCSPQKKRAVMLGITGFMALAAVLLNDKMNSTEAWLTWVGAMMGPTFVQEHGPNGFLQPKAQPPQEVPFDPKLAPPANGGAA